MKGEIFLSTDFADYTDLWEMPIKGAQRKYALLGQKRTIEFKLKKEE